MSKIYVILTGKKVDDSVKYIRELTALLCNNNIKDATSSNGINFIIGEADEDKFGLIKYLYEIDALPLASEKTMEVIAPDILSWGLHKS